MMAIKNDLGLVNKPTNYSLPNQVITMFVTLP
jgi:hypothetical protein